MGELQAEGRYFLRLAAFVSADISEGSLVLVHKVSMPRIEVSYEVDVVRLVVVHGMEVIIAVDRVQGAVVGELLLGDGRVILKAKDGSDVVLALDGGQFTPTVRSIRHCPKPPKYLVLILPFFPDSRVLAALCAVRGAV